MTLSIPRELPDEPMPPARRLSRPMSLRRRKQAKRAFLAHFGRSGIVSWSCEAAGIGSRRTVYEWLDADPEFAAAFEHARNDATETLEREAWRRAVEGSPYTRTSYWHGEPVGTDAKIEYSDALMALLLKARAPEKYRESSDIVVTQIVKTVSGIEPADVL